MVENKKSKTSQVEKDQTEESQISEVIQSKTIENIIKENDTDIVFNIKDDKDFSPIFKYLISNVLISEEMNKILKELEQILKSKVISFSKVDILMIRLVRYYKLNVSTLALYHYDDKVRGDVENIIRVLKAFIIKNRVLISENTKHILLEKKSNNCEFNTVVTAENLEIFDIFEKVSLNNLEAVLPKAKTIFTDIYTSWILSVILAMSLDKTDYVVKEDVKKTHIDILKEKIALLNTDLTNPKIKSLINVAKKEKVNTPKPKKLQETISEEDKKNIEKINLKDTKVKPKGKKVSSKKQISVDISNAEKEISDDLPNLSDESEVIQEGDLEM